MSGKTSQRYIGIAEKKTFHVQRKVAKAEKNFQRYMIHNACKCFYCFAKAHSTLYTPQDYYAIRIFPLFKEHSDLFSFSFFFTHISFIFSLILYPPFSISFSFVFLLLSLYFIFFLLFCQPPLSSVFIP